MSILITGKSGFVGSNLFQYLLKANFQVKSFSFKNNQKIGPIDDEISSIIHLTGKAHDLKKASNPEEYYKVNVDYTKQIFERFLNSKAAVFIYLSSVKAVTDKKEGTLKEDDVPNPQTHYGKSKLIAEEYILSRLPKNKRVYIFRPCMIHGPNNKGNLTLFYNFVKKGFPYPLGAYDNKRSFLSVENLCFVIKEFISRPDIPSGVYHIADDESFSTKELIKLIGDLSQKKIKVLNVPKFLINILASMGDYLPCPLNTERVEKMTENYVVSNQKLKNTIGKELPITTKDGLVKTIKSFKK